MVNNKQLAAMIINAFAVKMLMTYPRSLVVISGNAAWISVLCSTVLAWLIFYVLTKVYPIKKNIIQIAGDIGGDVLRIFIGIIVFIIMSLNLMSLVRIFPEIIKLVLLQTTYIELIGLTFIASLVIGAMCGIKSIARVHSLFIPIAAVFFGIFILMLLPSVNVYSMFPMFGKGYFSVFVDGLSGMSVFSDLILLNMLVPYCENTESYKKAGSKSIIIGGACACVIMLMYCLTYVYPLSEYFYIPVYQLERLINLSSFFSRFEAFFQFIWTISILLYGALYFAVLGDVWQTTFKLNSSTPLLSPIAVLIVGAAMMADTVSEMVDFEFVVMKWIYIPVFLLPILFALLGKKKYK